MSRRIVLCSVLIGLFLAGLSGSVLAQDDELQLRLLEVDTAAFPTVHVTLLTTDETGAPAADLSQISLRENGSVVSDLSYATTPLGIDITFVLDANLGFREVDDDGGLTRDQKVRESIERFTQFYMDPEGRDRVSIVVPASDGLNGRFLVQNATSAQEVVDALAAYDAGPLRPTPLNAMLALALDGMQQLEPDRYRALLLFTDSRLLPEQLSYPLLTAQANDVDTPIYVSILGAAADAQEIDNARRLYEPTRASYVHMPQANGTDPLYDIWQQQGNPIQLIYPSRRRESGPLQIDVSLGAVQDSAAVDLLLEAPQLSVQPAEVKVRRMGVAPDTTLTDLQPAVWPFVLEITWPDNLPRRLSDVKLLSAGRQLPLTVELPDAPVSTLPITVDISQEDEGAFDLTVQVTDELGFAASSAIIPIQISVQRPLPSTAVPTPLPTAAPASTPFPLPAFPLEYLAAGIALLAALLLALFWRARMRRRRARALQTPLEGQAVLAAQGQDSANTILLPRLQQLTGENKASISLAAGNLTIGRTPGVAQIVLPDKSLSHLHARIRQQGDTYWLLDEGSAEGTYLNYERLGLAPVELQDGDIIQFGAVSCAFRLQTQVAIDAEEAATAIPSPDIAVIFDMDGLMVDTEPLSRQAWDQVLGAMGVDSLDDSQYNQLIGRRLQETAELLADAYDLPVDPAVLGRQKNEAFAEIRAAGVPVMPGLHDLLEKLERLNVPWGVATSSPRQVAEEIVAQLGLTESCQAIAAGDEVAQGKPAPDVYLLAAERLNVPPQQCLAFEDSMLGCQSAHAGGLVTVVVPTVPADPDQFPCADAVLPSLEVVPAQLEQLLAQLRQR